MISGLIAIISFILNIVVNALYISAKSALKALKFGAKATKVTAKGVKKVYSGTKKVVSTSSKVAKSTVGVAARGVQNVSNIAKTSVDLVSSDEDVRKSARKKVGNTTKNIAFSASRLATKSAIISLKLTIFILKLILNCLRFLVTLLVTWSTFLSLFLFIIIGAIASSVWFGLAVSTDLMNNTEISNGITPTYNGEEVEDDNNSSASANSGDWLSAVDTVSQWYVTDVKTYNQGGKSKCPLIGNKSVRWDCSGLVTACLIYYGVDISSTSSGDYCKKQSEANKGFQAKLESAGFEWHDGCKHGGSCSDLQPGDIMVKSKKCHGGGHVEIIGGKDDSGYKVYTWGAASSVLPRTGISESRYSKYCGYWRKVR